MRIPILLVYHSLQIGGVEMEILAYIKHLDKNQYSIHLALNRVEGELLINLPDYVTIHQVNGNSVTPNIFYLFSLYKVIKKVKPAIVIGFMQDINIGILITQLITPFKYKSIVCEQVVLSEWQRFHKTSLLKLLLIRFLYRRANAVFAQSESIVEDLATNFRIDKNKIYLIPSYIDEKKFNTTHLQSNVFKRLRPYFLFVGRQTSQKGLNTLIYAFTQFSRNYPNINLLFIGPINPQYKKLCSSLRILNKVKFIGYVSNPNTYYRNALALIIPSYVEGRSRVMIEAMLCNCPVICSDFPGHDKYIRNGISGLVFTKGTIQNLTAKLTFAANKSKTIKRFASYARTRIAQIHILKNRLYYKSYLNKSIQTILC